jgi:hypothetical protein
MVWIPRLTDNAKDHRHGNRTVITDETANEITKRSWVIMNRFFEYRKRGSQPLSIDEFQILSG